MPPAEYALPVEDRFWAKVRKTDTCWLWLGSPGDGGYGRFWVGTRKKSRNLMAHRVAYEFAVGPIPEGLTLDHLCKNTLCVNPAHLEPVTITVNVMRGDGPPAQHARKTHCMHGHELAGDNLWINKRGWRVCCECRRTRAREAYRAKAARAREEKV